MTVATFILIPFAADRERLAPGCPKTFRSSRKALRAAYHEACRNAGVLLIEQPSDPYAEPRLVHAAGQLPEGTCAHFAA